MTRSCRWILLGVLLFAPLAGLFAQVTTFLFHADTTYRELNPPNTDGCALPPWCHYHPGMETWGNDSPMKEYCYTGKDVNGTVVEFMNWRILFPVGFSATNPTKYPMIIMLHGSGESGRLGCCGTNWAANNVKYDNNDMQVQHGGKEHQTACGYSYQTGLPSGPVNWPGIVIWPQSSYNASWEGGWNNGVLANDGRMATIILDYIIKTAKFNVDPDRISIHGLSNGAQGGWDVAAKRPDLFAAFLPMSGVATNYQAQTDVLVTTPIWQFQGGLDKNPNPQASLDLYNMLVAKGGNPKYTLYPNLAHGTWTTAYAEPDFFPFMLRADKKNIYVFGGDPSICPGGSLKLGFSAGYTNYQWKLNGADITGATSRYYNATVPGAYTVRFTRVTDSSIGTSYPVTVVATPASTFKPPLTNTGSVILPIAIGDVTAAPPQGPLGGVSNFIKLTAPLGYSTYSFFKSGVLIAPGSSSNTYTFSSGTGASADAGNYTVKVVLANGCTSLDSDPIAVTWTPVQPSAPKPGTPTMATASSTSVSVNWSDVSGETGYEVWRFRFPSGSYNYATGLGGYTDESWRLVTVLPANTVSFTDQGLRPSASYRYRIRAIQSTGGATFSDEPTTTGAPSADITPPTVPTNFSVSDIRDTQATLTWSPSADNDVVYKYQIFDGATKFNIALGKDVIADTLFNVAPTYDRDLTDGSPAPPTTFTLKNLTPLTTYFVSVRAVDYSANALPYGNVSPFSDVLIFTTTTPSVNGLTYNYYTTTSAVSTVGTFNFAQPPNSTGTVTVDATTPGTYSTSLLAPRGSRTTNFVFSYDAQIQIDQAGQYTFYTDSDDGSRLYINGQEVVNNDGSHGIIEKSGAYTFGTPGRYPFRVIYAQGGGGYGLYFYYAGPSITKVLIPNIKLWCTGTDPTTTFYFKPTATDLTNLINWGKIADGSGANPIDFTTNFQKFNVVTNLASVTLTSPWTVSGNGSKVIVTSGKTVNLNAVFTGTLEAQSNAVINANNASLPKFGVLDPTSTVNFNIGGSNTIANGSYGHMNLLNSASSTYTFPLSSTIISGNFTVANGVTALGSATNQSVLSVGGNVTFNNTNPNPATTNQYALKFAGGIAHTVNLTVPNDLNLFGLQAGSGDAIQINYNDTNPRTLTVGTSQGGGLILGNNSTLTMLNNNLVVQGNGAINPNSETGIIAMSGGNFTLTTTGLQNSNVYFSTSANQVNNFIFSTPSNTRIAVLSQANIRNLVTLSSGELNSNSGSLTLLSDATGTARIGAIASGAKITGSITAQRYMPLEAAGKIYRYISSPVIGLTAATLQQYIPITGNFTGSSTGLAPSPSMFSYTEPPAGPGYVNFPAPGGTNQDTLRRGKGYAIYVREPTNPTTWVATGTPYQGTIPFTLTAGTPSPSDGWNLLGNPYPCPIQWTGTGTTSAGWPVMTNINPTVYVRHNFGAQYKWYIYRQGVITLQGDQLILANGVIAPGQAFWVQAGVSPVLSIAEAAKYTPDGGTFYRTGSTARAAGTPDVLAIRLSNSVYDDVTYVMHGDQGTENYEKSQDAAKQRNSFFNLSTRSKDGISLAINVTPVTFCQKDVKLDIENAAVGNYTLSFFGMAAFQRPVTAFLQDNFTGKTSEIKEGTTYDFAITTDATSTGPGRFVLTEKPIVLTNATLKSTGVCESNPSITLLTTQPGVQYQALYNGGVVSEAMTSSGENVKLTLDRKALGYGTHTVNLTAGFPGCDVSTLDQTISVTVDTLQTPSIVYQSGGFLAASPANADEYQWLLDGSPLKGKTEATLNDNNVTGNYQVRVSAGACSKVSTPFDITSVEDVNSLVKVYPNPFRDQIVVTLPEKIQGGTATLINPIGQRVQSVSIAPQDSYDLTLNFAGVEAGPYVLSVGRYRFKVIKIN